MSWLRLTWATVMLLMDVPSLFIGQRPHIALVTPLRPLDVRFEIAVTEVSCASGSRGALRHRGQWSMRQRHPSWQQ